MFARREPRANFGNTSPLASDTGNQGAWNLPEVRTLPMSPVRTSIRAHLHPIRKGRYSSSGISSTALASPSLMTEPTQTRQNENDTTSCGKSSRSPHHILTPASVRCEVWEDLRLGGANFVNFSCVWCGVWELSAPLRADFRNILGQNTCTSACRRVFNK